MISQLIRDISSVLPPFSVPTDKIPIGFLLFSLNCVMIKADSNKQLEQKRSNTRRDDDEKIGAGRYHTGAISTYSEILLQVSAW